MSAHSNDGTPSDEETSTEGGRPKDLGSRPRQGSSAAGGESSRRKRRKRPAWSLEEESVLAEKHALHGNSWITIARSLPGRTPGEVKNIYNSTLRATRHGTRSLLRAYVMAVRGRENDDHARREAYRAALQTHEAETEAVGAATAAAAAALERIPGAASTPGRPAILAAGATGVAALDLGSGALGQPAHLHEWPWLSEAHEQGPRLELLPTQASPPQQDEADRPSDFTPGGELHPSMLPVIHLLPPPGPMLPMHRPPPRPSGMIWQAVRPRSRPQCLALFESEELALGPGGGGRERGAPQPFHSGPLNASPLATSAPRRPFLAAPSRSHLDGEGLLRRTLSGCTENLKDGEGSGGSVLQLRHSADLTSLRERDGAACRTPLPPPPIANAADAAILKTPTQIEQLAMLLQLTRSRDSAVIDVNRKRPRPMSTPGVTPENDSPPSRHDTLTPKPRQGSGNVTPEVPRLPIHNRSIYAPTGRQSGAQYAMRLDEQSPSLLRTLPLDLAATASPRATPAMVAARPSGGHLPRSGSLPPQLPRVASLSLVRHASGGRWVEPGLTSVRQQVPSPQQLPNPLQSPGLAAAEVWREGGAGAAPGSLRSAFELGMPSLEGYRHLRVLQRAGGPVAGAEGEPMLSEVEEGLAGVQERPVATAMAALGEPLCVPRGSSTQRRGGAQHMLLLDPTASADLLDPHTQRVLISVPVSSLTRAATSGVWATDVSEVERDRSANGSTPLRQLRNSTLPRAVAEDTNLRSPGSDGIGASMASTPRGLSGALSALHGQDALGGLNRTTSASALASYNLCAGSTTGKAGRWAPLLTGAAGGFGPALERRMGGGEEASRSMSGAVRVLQMALAGAAEMGGSDFSGSGAFTASAAQRTLARGEAMGNVREQYGVEEAPGGGSGGGRENWDMRTRNSDVEATIRQMLGPAGDGGLRKLLEFGGGGKEETGSGCALLVRQADGAFAADGGERRYGGGAARGSGSGAGSGNGEDLGMRLSGGLGSSGGGARGVGAAAEGREGHLSGGISQRGTGGLTALCLLAERDWESHAHAQAMQASRSAALASKTPAAVGPLAASTEPLSRPCTSPDTGSGASAVTRAHIGARFRALPHGAYTHPTTPESDRLLNAQGSPLAALMAAGATGSRVANAAMEALSSGMGGLPVREALNRQQQQLRANRAGVRQGHESAGSLKTVAGRVPEWTPVTETMPQLYAYGDPEVLQVKLQEGRIPAGPQLGAGAVLEHLNTFEGNLSLRVRWGSAPLGGRQNAGSGHDA